MKQITKAITFGALLVMFGLGLLSADAGAVVSPIAASSSSETSLGPATKAYYIPFSSYPLGSCPGSLKAELPWYPQNYGTNADSPTNSGSSLGASGNCATRFDQGSFVDGSNIGNWIKNGYGPWRTQPLLWGSASANATSVTMQSDGLDPSQAIWGQSGNNTTNYHCKMFNNKTGCAPALYSNGSTLFQQTFTVSAADLSNGSTFVFDVSADDWYIAYINGNYLVQQYSSSGRSTVAIPKAYLQSGSNIIAVQAIDKAVWDSKGRGPSAGRASGLRYTINIDRPTYAATPSISASPASGSAPEGDAVGFNFYIRNASGGGSANPSYTIRVTDNSGNLLVSVVSGTRSVSPGASIEILPQFNKPSSPTWGGKACAIMTLTRANSSGSEPPPAKACVTIEFVKSPKFQVRGGDIRVGSSYTDQTTTSVSNITTSQTVKNR